MRESKTAEFKDIELKATFVDGALEKVSVYGNGETHEPMILDAKEAGELYVWLGSIAIMSRSGSITPPTWVEPMTGQALLGISTTTPLAGVPDALTGGLPRITDAESVAKRVPLSKVLAADGMKLEERSVASQEVTFAPMPGKPKS